jgi:hypothetical protein
MHPVRLAALLLAGTGIAVTAHAGFPVDGAFAAAQLLKNARTYHVEVDQSFAFAPGTTLPFEDAVHALLGSAGLERAPGDFADVRVSIHAEGRPLSRRYNDIRRVDAVEHFSGAEITGWVHFTAADGRSEKTDFVSRRRPPLNISRSYEDRANAPYAGSFTGFVKFFSRTVSLAYGKAPMVAILQCSDEQDYFYTVPQLQWCAAEELADIGGEDVKAVLLQALQSFSAHRQAGAARGLRLLGAKDALPQLIGALNTVDGGFPENFESDTRWQSMSSVARALDPVETDDGFLEPWNEILAAIASVEGVAKTGPLLAVLRNPDSALARTGAALLLGRERDGNAFKPLLSAAKNDENTLVRLAAVNALGELRDERTAVELQALLASAEDGPVKATIKRNLEQVAAEATALAGNTDTK